jgi:TetR/AcrR family transcriptional repressor of nem operon
VLKRYLSTSHRDDASDGCPLPAVVGEIATAAPEHREVLAEQLDDLAADLSRYLPREGASRRTTALATIALMFGGLSLARAVKGTALSDEILRACRAFGRLG